MTMDWTQSVETIFVSWLKKSVCDCCVQRNTDDGEDIINTTASQDLKPELTQLKYEN